MTNPTENTFKVGCVYRDGRGLACLVKSANCKTMRVTEWVGDCWAVGDCRHELADGRFSVYSDRDSWYHLIPGELVQRDGQWVPLEQTASLTFPSGATLKVAGDKIVGRVAPEPIRPALDWNTATPFDTFGADFIVTKGAEPTKPLHTSPTTDSAYPAIAGLLRG